MALRDPGAPRRNPLFVAAPAAAPPDPTGVPRFGAGDGGAAGDEAPAWTGGGAEHDSARPGAARIGSALGPLAAALQEAGPEAAEHLVNAAHELTLAVKVVVDALERGLAEQRGAFAAEGGARPAAPSRPATDADRGRFDGTVHRIDIE
jgi:hypothetical protein